MLGCLTAPIHFLVIAGALWLLSRRWKAAPPTDFFAVLIGGGLAIVSLVLGWTVIVAGSLALYEGTCYGMTDSVYACTPIEWMQAQSFFVLVDGFFAAPFVLSWGLAAGFLAKRLRKIQE